MPFESAPYPPPEIATSRVDLSREVWRLRCGYAQALLDNPVIEEAWELDKRNPMFTKAFIEAIEATPRRKLAGFMGVGEPSAH